MAEWNSCASLLDDEKLKEGVEKYNELLEQGKDPFTYMLNMQYDLQVALANKSPEFNPSPDSLINIGQKFDWLRENKQAFDDEYREIIDALPGMETPEKDRSAVWKRWKTKYSDIRSKTFAELSEDELKELKFELTDSFHFFMNMFFALDMDAREMFVYYYFKNAENHRRAQNGY